MHWTLTLIACLVLWAGVGGLWRAGSLALAAEWIAGQLIWIVTGVQVPVAFYRVADLAIIAVFVLRPMSALDVAIVAIFPAQWAFYAWDSGAHQWWWLWALTCVQLVLAGPWPALQRGAGEVSHGPLRREVRQ